MRVSRAAGRTLQNRSSLLRPGFAITAVGLGVVLIGTVGLTVFRGSGGPATPGPGGSLPAATSGPGGSVAAASTVGPIGPPSATPLANPPSQPSGDGTKVTISTKLGDIVIEIYNRSAPVASQNFVNLANAGFYNGVTFHRLVPGFVIQGGDPAGDGSGGPGYSIRDEPVVGAYKRGIVAMARTQAPNSQGSQFFIVLDDSAAQALDAYRTYVIFGNVVSGMDVADGIAAMPNAGSDQGNQAIDPVVMDRVTVQSP
jgi:peptidyl-prolyl cis-trans isomerase B (cyclophilin B)